MLEQRLHATGKRVPGGFKTRDEHQHAVPADLRVRQGLPIHLGVGEQCEWIVHRAAPALVRQAEAVLGHVVESLQRCLGVVIEALVGHLSPAQDPHPILFRHFQDVGDHGHRDPSADIGDEIALSRSRQVVEDAPDDFGATIGVIQHRFRFEWPFEDRPHFRVPWRVGRQDALADAETLLRHDVELCGERRHLPGSSGVEEHRIVQYRSAFRVLEDRPEADAIVAHGPVDGIVPPHLREQLVDGVLVAKEIRIDQFLIDRAQISLWHGDSPPVGLYAGVLDHAFTRRSGIGKYRKTEKNDIGQA